MSTVVVVAKREAGEEVFVPLDLPTALAGHLEGGQLTWLGLGLGSGLGLLGLTLTLTRTRTLTLTLTRGVVGEGARAVGADAARVHLP